MEFDTYVVARLLEGPRPPQLTEREQDELQDAHLAHIADLWAAGALIAAGPAAGPGGLRGVSVFTCSLDEARALGDRDPAVVAGVYVHEYAEWRTPRGMVVRGPGVPPRSIADVMRSTD